MRDKFSLLWFAWKFVPLWYQQQQGNINAMSTMCCDLLENSYLCGISNNFIDHRGGSLSLWFAWKFVPLWYQQQPETWRWERTERCDLLENSYLCGISNNRTMNLDPSSQVVICLKIRTFVVSATTDQEAVKEKTCCDLLENSYLCGISNNLNIMIIKRRNVVICLKIRTFVVSATTVCCYAFRT